MPAPRRMGQPARPLLVSAVLAPKQPPNKPIHTWGDDRPMTNQQQINGTTPGQRARGCRSCCCGLCPPPPKPPGWPLRPPGLAGWLCSPWAAWRARRSGSTARGGGPGPAARCPGHPAGPAPPAGHEGGRSGLRANSVCHHSGPPFSVQPELVCGHHSGPPLGQKNDTAFDRQPPQHGCLPGAWAPAAGRRPQP